MVGAMLGNLELLVDPSITPWPLTGLLARGLTCSHANLKRALVEWFKKASQEKEWENVSHDLAIFALNCQKQSDNTKSIVSGYIYNGFVLDG